MRTEDQNPRPSGRGVVNEVVFHFNVADKRVHACRLLRKAYLQGARLLVVAEPQELDPLDTALWTLTGRDFIPHARLSDAAEVQTHSPILLAGEWPAEAPHLQDRILVNLSDGFLSGFDRFVRVIEVVSRDQPDRERARERWKGYRAAGSEPTHHDFAAR
jgi:DNA polymerase-3 subunit chi